MTPIYNKLLYPNMDEITMHFKSPQIGAESLVLLMLLCAFAKNKIKRGWLIINKILVKNLRNQLNSTKKYFDTCIKD